MNIFDAKHEREKQYLQQQQASSLVKVSPKFQDRYKSPVDERTELLRLQRLKFLPTESVVKKARKKARKGKRTKNLKGEYAKIKREQRRFERGERRDAPGKEPYILGEDFATRMAGAVAAGVAAGGGGGGVIGPAVAPGVAPVVPPAVVAPAVVGGGGPVGAAPVGAGPHLAQIGALRAQMDQARQEILRLGREDRGIPRAELRDALQAEDARYNALAGRLEQVRGELLAEGGEGRAELMARLGGLGDALDARIGEAEAGVRRLGEAEGRNIARFDEGIAEVRAGIRAGNVALERRQAQALEALEQRHGQELEEVGRLLEGHQRQVDALQAREEAGTQRSAVQGAELGELQRERGALQRRLEQLESTHLAELEALRRQQAEQGTLQAELDTRLSGRQDDLGRDIMELQRVNPQAYEERLRGLEERLTTTDTGIREELRQRQAQAHALDDRLGQQERGLQTQRELAERLDQERQQRETEQLADLREEISGVYRRAALERGEGYEVLSERQQELLRDHARDQSRQLAELEAEGERRVGDVERQLQEFREEVRGAGRASPSDADVDDDLKARRREQLRERLREAPESPGSPEARAEPEALDASGVLVDAPEAVQEQVEEDIAVGQRAQAVEEGEGQEPGYLQRAGEGAAVVGGGLRDVALAGGDVALRAGGGLVGGAAERVWEAVPPVEDVAGGLGRGMVEGAGMLLQGGVAIGEAALEGAGLIGGGEEEEPAEVHRQLPNVPVGADELGGGGGERHAPEGLELDEGGGAGRAGDQASLAQRRESVRLWESPEFQTGLGLLAERGRPMGGRERTHRIRNVSDESIWGIEPGEYREIMGAEHESGGTEGRPRVKPKVRIGERGTEGFSRHDQDVLDARLREGRFILEPSD